MMILKHGHNSIFNVKNVYFMIFLLFKVSDPKTDWVTQKLDVRSLYFEL